MKIRAWIGLAILTGASCTWFGKEDTHVIPAQYRGPVIIRFNQPNGTHIERDWRGNVTYRIAADGKLSVKEEPPGKGRWMRFVATSEAGQQRAFPVDADGGQVDVFAETFGTNEIEGYKYIAYIVGDRRDQAFVKRATSELWAAVSPPFGLRPRPSM